jgi:hypothetical protein
VPSNFLGISPTSLGHPGVQNTPGLIFIKISKLIYAAPFECHIMQHPTCLRVGFSLSANCARDACQLQPNAKFLAGDGSSLQTFRLHVLDATATWSGLMSSPILETLLTAVLECDLSSSQVPTNIDQSPADFAFTGPVRFVTDVLRISTTLHHVRSALHDRSRILGLRFRTRCET